MSACRIHALAVCGVAARPAMIVSDLEVMAAIAFAKRHPPSEQSRAAI